MRSTIKSLGVVVGAGVALVASVFTAFATPAAPVPVDYASARQASVVAGRPAEQNADCPDLKPTGVAWVKLTADHHVGKQVLSYPSGSTSITPIFQYNCAPDNTTIVSVFSLNGLTIFTDQEQISGSSLASLYGYDLETTDGSPLSDGKWGVQFFNNKSPLTGGAVNVGAASTDPSQTTDVTVQGIVQDQNSQSPIEGAVILVLNPGVQIQDFIKNGEKTSDTFTVGKSDSQGAFKLANKLQRNQVYDMIVKATGYRDVGNNSFEVTNEPDPVSITVSMTQ